MRASSAAAAARTALDDYSAQIAACRAGTSIASRSAGMASMHDTRLHPSPAVRASISVDGLVLLDMDGGLVLSSNVVGARIWELIEQQRTACEIARQLAADYDVPDDRAHRDVAAFIDALVARGLVAGDAQP